MAGMLRVSRSRGAFSGALLVLLGVWGGLIPFVGPYLHFAYTPDKAWTWTSGRLWLDVLPAAATVAGGLAIGMSRLRPVALFGAILAAVGGAWFALGTTLAPLWMSVTQGTAVGGHITRVLEQVGFYTGLGIVIICIASVAGGRLAVVSVRDTRPARHAASTPVTPEPDAAPAASTPARDDAPVSGPRTGGFSLPKRVTFSKPRTSGSGSATATADRAEESETVGSSSGTG